MQGNLCTMTQKFLLPIKFNLQISLPQTYLECQATFSYFSMELIVNIEIKETHFCRSDLRIATKLTGSRESEFPPTPQSALLILKSTIVCHRRCRNPKRFGF